MASAPGAFIRVMRAYSVFCGLGGQQFEQAICFISKEELSGAIRRVSLLSTERSKGIKFYLEKNRVRLFSSNPEIGEARDKLDVEYKGQELEIGFNAQYLLGFLLTVASDRVCFEIKDENSAVLLKPETEEEIKNVYVLMPMKI